MGFLCLRVEEQFFATCDHRTGELMVKLPRERVQELIDGGSAHPFAPSGQVFRGRALVPERYEQRWAGLMAEARSFVEGTYDDRKGG